jgi:hypothetical protein
MTEKNPECSYFTISHSISIVHNAYYLKATVFGSSLYMLQNIFQIFEILENLKYLKIEIFPIPILANSNIFEISEKVHP